MEKFAVLTTMLLGLSTCAFATEKNTAGIDSDPSSSRWNYAERMYADYAADSEEPVDIAVKSQAGGSMKDLAGRTMESIVGLPTHHIEAEDGAVQLTGTQFVALDASKINFTELERQVDEFNGVGFPIAEGYYRILDVSVSINTQVQNHSAVEFCWPARAHCIVFDPTIEFVDAIVTGHQERKVRGWAPRIVSEPAAVSRDLPTCGLSSNHGLRSRGLYWQPYRIDYYNLLHQTIIRKELGSQEVGISCDWLCNAGPYAYSKTSSAKTFLGGVAYSVDCGNAAVSGSSGRTGKAKAETKCSHRLTFGARADASVRGVDLGVEIDWNTQGSIDSRGGSLSDTCGYY